MMKELERIEQIIKEEEPCEGIRCSQCPFSCYEDCITILRYERIKGIIEEVEDGESV